MPPSAPVKLASAEAKLGRPRICSRKSSAWASEGLLAMGGGIGDEIGGLGRVRVFREHLHAKKKKREREDF